MDTASVADLLVTAYGDSSMGNSLWFITLLQEKPWAGFLIGLAFMALMFGSKNLIVYFYARNQEKKRRLAQSAPDDDRKHV